MKVKRFFVIAALAIFFGMVVYGAVFAQTTDTTTTTTTTDVATVDTTQSVTFGLLSMGQDNLYLKYFDGGTPFLAIGGGFDIARYSKKLSYGGTFEATLHATAAAKVTGDSSAALVGGSINIDVVKLITGTDVTILLSYFRLLLGPSLAYDTNAGKWGYGGLLNFSYTF